MSEYTVVVTPQSSVVVTTAAVQGPPGPPGPPGSAGAQTIELVAAETLSGHRVVVANNGAARYPVRLDNGDADAVIGITLNAAVAGQPVVVQASGEMTESSWNWAAGPIWVGDNGMLTQTPPTSGWVQIIATAIAPNKIIISPRQSILPPN